VKKVLFIDRDGTIIKEPEDEQIDSFEKLEFLPNVLSGLKSIFEKDDYELVMVTNQDGLGTDSFPENTFWPTHNLMMNILTNEGISFSEICIDKSFPHENLPTRKPRTGLLTNYMKGNYDLAGSFVLGDRLTDVELAKNLGSKAIFINEGSIEVPAELKDFVALTTPEWTDITKFLCEPERKGSVERNTNETKIKVSVNLDGTGKSEISTGLNFFDHMLEQLSRHSNCDMLIKVDGDLHVDEHHTMEDTAIALGDAFLQALGNKKGIERYGFLLPMDDCLAQAAIDFSGRPWLVWEAGFKREMIGDTPTEMFFHFFKSFSDASKCNLNIKAEGENEHHKIEAIYKAVAKSIKGAVNRNSKNVGLPSTKGVL